MVQHKVNQSVRNIEETVSELKLGPFVYVFLIT